MSDGGLVPRPDDQLRRDAAKELERQQAAERARREAEEKKNK